MQTAHNMKEYHKDLGEAIEDAFLRETLDKFAIAYQENRKTIFADQDLNALIADVATAKKKSTENLDQLLAQFKEVALHKGIHVHVASNAAEANQIIVSIAEENNCKNIIKSKSMTIEEIGLNPVLEAKGFNVTETDLAEWIIQLRHEGPSHMVLPAIHLSRYQVAGLFKDVTGREQDSDPQKLVKVARRELRPKFAEADMGITGGNFAVADTATIGLCTNEGNGRIVSTLPRVHVAVVGLEKLVPNLRDALKIIRILPKNATAQEITSYVSWVTGVNIDNNGEKKSVHVVFLDNGRSNLAKDPLCGQVLHCVRCGACANVCPVYRLVGGHKMGHIYIGAIGLILTYFFHGREKARNLIQNCINCGACKEVCSAGIDLPEIIVELRSRLMEDEGAPVAVGLIGKVMGNRKLFHTLLRFAKYAQLPVTTGSPYIRHLPSIFAKGHGFRALPALAKTSFRDKWKKIQPPAQNGIKIGLFSGCAQDFIYPEQLEQALSLFVSKGCSVDFPMNQTCCGVPLQMMGERDVAEQVALQNIKAFDAAKFDYIVTLCPTCASFMKHQYESLLQEDRNHLSEVRQFSSRVIDFSSFTRDVLKIGEKDLRKTDEKVTYHAPCHLCRGMNVIEQPKALLNDAAEFTQAEEENSCCGFGGSYSVKFPEISSNIMERKIKNFSQTGVQTLVTDCPGCVLQLRGGMVKKGINMQVEHMSEFLARHLK